MRAHGTESLRIAGVDLAPDGHGRVSMAAACTLHNRLPALRERLAAAEAAEVHAIECTDWYDLLIGDEGRTFQQRQDAADQHRARVNAATAATDRALRRLEAAERAYERALQLTRVNGWY
jgi:hypothetical protein